MNFTAALPWFALCVSLGAQMVASGPQGGGELKLGATPYRFELTHLTSAPPAGGLPGALKWEGNLIPRDASRPFHMILTVLKNGSLYMLKIERKTSQGYPDSWAATLKTRTRFLKLEDQPGGRVEIRCEGPLTGIIAKHPENAIWSGQLWAIFPVGSPTPD